MFFRQSFVNLTNPVHHIKLHCISLFGFQSKPTKKKNPQTGVHVSTEWCQVVSQRHRSTSGRLTSILQTGNTMWLKRDTNVSCGIGGVGSGLQLDASETENNLET